MSPPASGTIARAIRDRAAGLGFQQVGFCDATPPPETAHFERWLAAGQDGTMSWLSRGRAPRLDPRLVLEGARSMIVVSMSYASPGAPAPAQPAADAAAAPFSPGSDAPARAGRVSRYATGDDYHRVLGDRLEILAAFIESSAPGNRALAYVDTGPLLERMWAARAGLGWVGKNSLVLNKERGSYFFLGEILTTLPLPPDEPAFDQCGACSLCIEACPTSAIVEPRVVDSRRCIAYHTIELRGPVPEAHREAIGDRVFGCDDCQDVCPWNRSGPGSRPSAAGEHFAPRPGSVDPPLMELLSMTHAEYLARFRGSAIRRATFRGLRRNAALAAGNTGVDSATLDALDGVALDESEDPVVREQAEWSARRVRERFDSGSPAGSVTRR